MKLTRLLSLPTAFLGVAASVGIASVVSNAAPASAISQITLKFVCARSNTAPPVGACDTGANQFRAVVSSIVTNPNQVKFSFMNVGANPSSIIKLDIFDKAQYSLRSFISVTGVPSSVSGSVVRFSSSSTLDTIKRFTYTASGNNAVQRNRGINSGESLDVILNIATGQPFDTVVTDLFDKGLSVEMTASGFGTGSSEVNTPVVFNSKVQPVPEPLTLLGSGAALGFGVLMKRRSSKLKAKKA